jgi:hypothetical protein
VGPRDVVKVSSFGNAENVSERERERENNVEGCVLQPGDFVTQQLPASCTVLMGRAEQLGRCDYEI